MSVANIARQIRGGLIAEIKKVAGIGHVSSDWVHWTNVTRFPACFVMRETSTQEVSPTRSKTVEDRFRLVWVLQSETPEDDFDDLADAAENEIEDDPSLGNLIEQCWVSAIGSFATSAAISGGVYVREMFVDAVYKHVRAAA
jgi:hypothetical protein